MSSEERPRKRVLLHVGTHKTGTTSIQVALSRLRPWLGERGILFPLTGAPASDPHGQHLLAWSVIERANYLPNFDPGPEGFGQEVKTRLWDALRAEIDAADAHTVVISSEEFDVLSAEEVRTIDRELAEYDVVPVIFLRNLADLIESSYRTSIVYGAMQREIDDYVNNQRIRLDYAQFVNEWRGIAANGEMAIFFYDDPKIRKGAVESFFSLLGIAASEIPGEQNANESVPAFVCEIMRFLRVKGVAEPQVIAWLRQMQGAGWAKGANADYAFLSPAARVALDLRYDSEVRQLRGLPGFERMAYGDPAYGHGDREPMVVSNVAVALLALGQALSARD